MRLGVSVRRDGGTGRDREGPMQGRKLKWVTAGSKDPRRAKLAKM